MTNVSGKFYDFLKKVCRFSHENLTVFTVKSKSLNVPVKAIKFFYKNLQIFPLKRVTFSCKNRHMYYQYLCFGKCCIMQLRMRATCVYSRLWGLWPGCISNCQTPRLNNKPKYLHCSYRPLPVHVKLCSQRLNWCLSFWKNFRL